MYKFLYSISVELTLSRMELDHLTALAATHYDSYCKATAQRGGFLFGWNNFMELGDKTSITVWVVSHQLDTCAKLLEQPSADRTIAAKLREAHKAMEREYIAINKLERLFKQRSPEPPACCHPAGGTGHEQECTSS
jgi:hypothetical protein